MEKPHAMPEVMALTEPEPLVMVLLAICAAEFAVSKLTATMPEAPTEELAPTAKSTDISALFCNASTTKAPLESTVLLSSPASATSPPRAGATYSSPAEGLALSP